jgi:Leucine-rich repeat (LRR) protein
MKISGTEVDIVSNPYAQSVAPIDRDYEDSIESLVVKGRWNDNIIDFMNKKNIKGLYLNCAKNFTCESFDFLLKIPELELLNIIYYPGSSLSSIEQLAKLRSLSLSCHWEGKLNISGLKKLVRCYVSYSQGGETVFECTSLKYLYIDAFKLRNFSSIGRLRKLEYLTIGNSSFNEPEALVVLNKLRKLVLLNCKKLDHLIGINELVNLEWLTIDGSTKINRIDEISSLKKLNVLQLSDNKEIESLIPIKNIMQLRALCFFGNTAIKDGDLSYLEEMPNLSLVGFTKRRHYSHEPARSWSWNNYGSGGIAVVRK